MASLAEIRAKLQAMESKTRSLTQSCGDNAMHRHWNIDEGISSTEVPIR